MKNSNKSYVKRIFTAATAALMITAFAGCTSSESSSSAETTAPSKNVESSSIDNESNESFDLKSLHTYSTDTDDDLAGIWHITAGEGSQYTDFYYMFNGEGKSILISGTSGYFSTYEYGKDDDGNAVFTTKLVFGINGTYSYKLSDDKNILKITNTDTTSRTTLKRVDDADFIPEPKKDASIDKELVGCWMSESGEYFCFDSNGVMYQNILDYMFAFSNYSAKNGKIVSTYTTADQETTDNFTYSVDGDTLTLNSDTYSKIPFSKLR